MNEYTYTQIHFYKAITAIGPQIGFVSSDKVNVDGYNSNSTRRSTTTTTTTTTTTAKSEVLDGVSRVICQLGRDGRCETTANQLTAFLSSLTV